VLLFLTESGNVKRTSLDQYGNIRSGGIAAIRLQEGDRVLDAQISEGVSDVVVVTRQGRAIRFPESEVPLQGRTTQGVKGVGLRKNDAVIGMVIVRREATLCTVTANGYAKRTPLSEYPVQKRGGLGTVTLDVTTKTGPLITAKELLSGDELMVITAGGRAIRLAADDVPEQGRATQGRRVLKPDVTDAVVEVARVAREGGNGEGGGDDGDGDDGGGPESADTSSAGSARSRRSRREQLDFIE
jgi:DNA gyrase subunit A